MPASMPGLGRLFDLPRYTSTYKPFVKRVRRRTVVGTTATIAAAAAEILGLASIALAATGDRTGLKDALLPAVGIAVAFILSGLMKALSDTQWAGAQIQLESSLRREITDAILTADWQDFVDQPGHELQSAALAEAPAVAQATVTHVRGRASMYAAALVFASTFVVSALAASITLVFGGLIGLAYRRASSGLGRAQHELAAGNASITRQTSILISGLRSLRLSPAQEMWRADLDVSFVRHAEARRRDLLIPVRARLLVDVLAALLMTTILLAQASISGTLLPGLIVMALVLRVVPRVQTAQQQTAFARHGVSWLHRWQSRLDAISFAPAHPDDSPPARAAGNTSTPVLQASGVEFAYRSHEGTVLKDVNLELHEGEWIALQGVSGGGKSTLIDVLGGLLLPQRGSVRLCGRPLAAIPVGERYQQLVIVPQEIQLMGDSVADIVTWGSRLDPACDIGPLMAALGVDVMFQFTTSVDDAKIDELGRNISGGMRTRIAMVRALAACPAVLILDETTSRLHPQAEADIFGAVRALRPDLAVIVVTHRQETLEHMDRNLRLEAGRLVDA